MQQICFSQHCLGVAKRGQNIFQKKSLQFWPLSWSFFFIPLYHSYMGFRLDRDQGKKRGCSCLILVLPMTLFDDLVMVYRPGGCFKTCPLCIAWPAISILTVVSVNNSHWKSWKRHLQKELCCKFEEQIILTWWDEAHSHKYQRWIWICLTFLWWKLWFQNGKHSHYVHRVMCSVHVDCGTIGLGQCSALWHGPLLNRPLKVHS